MQGDPSFLWMASQPIAMNFVLPLEFNSNVILLSSPIIGIALEYGLTAENVMGAGQSNVVEFKRKCSNSDVAIAHPPTLEADVSSEADVSPLVS